MNKSTAMLTLSVSVLAAALALPATAQAQPGPAAAAVPGPAKKKAGDQLTVITAEHLVFDYANAFAIFEENVVVVDKDLKLTSDKLTVRFSKENDVKYIEATGNVLIKQEDRTAQSERATYDVPTGKITLTLDPQIMRDRDLIKGEVIVLWRDENKMVVTKPQVLIFPKQGEKTRGKILGAGGE